MEILHLKHFMACGGFPGGKTGAVCAAARGLLCGAGTAGQESENGLDK